jgi:hypothetical protein
VTAYQEQFPAGTSARVADLETLTKFMRPTWRFHHPVEADQSAYAGRLAVVRNVSFYHGGDVLYELDGVPGTWHEACLRPDTSVRR